MRGAEAPKSKPQVVAGVGTSGAEGALEALVVDALGQFAGEFSKRLRPVVPAGAAIEGTRGGGAPGGGEGSADLVKSACFTQGDGQNEFAEALAEAEGTPEPGHYLFAV